MNPVNDRANAPIHEHADPDGKDSEVQYMDHEDRARNSAQPHSEGGDDHGKLDVACCPEPIRRDEAHGPEKGLHERDQQDHLQAKFSRVRFHTGQPDDRPRKRICEETGRCDHYFGPDSQLLNIEDCLVFVTCA